MNEPAQPKLSPSARSYLLRYNLVAERLVDELNQVAAGAMIRRHKRRRMLKRGKLLLICVFVIIGGFAGWRLLLTKTEWSFLSKFKTPEDKRLEIRLKEMIIKPIGSEEGLFEDPP